MGQNCRKNEANRTFQGKMVETGVVEKGQNCRKNGGKGTKPQQKQWKQDIPQKNDGNQLFLGENAGKMGQNGWKNSGNVLFHGETLERG